MGKRFSRCLGMSLSTSAVASDDAFGSGFGDEHAMAAIAMELDDDESNNPGLILPVNNEV
jgi:hypothetical protein|tara:strand:+ start:437 stop:616 length:180 start_codon:yes stop_codon:yes gene_type:complete